ncbi:TldD/PmbA family protein [Methanosphaera sp. ISO3-F5]|uniref:TldD/PmbA family protein n=1 Tax=Methanosphaera sp. ISO3-F5 TaxID=1452353 RepID=UPI002B25EE29|nr:TldD/PmbA family protein [Methanosphaera sp. ISO3-F5]WQH63234.1 TldD/PmbA family protein [Methanosphaera sp. ISO3-F5]
MTTGIDVDYFQKIIRKLESKVEYADIRVKNSVNNSIVLKDGKIDNVDTGINYAIGIRVLQNGAWGSAFTSDIEKVEQVAENATTIANQLKSDVKLTSTNPEEDIVKSKAKIKIEDVTIEDKISTMKELHKIAQRDQIQSTNVSLSESQSSDLIISSEGTNILSDNNRTVLSMNSVASNGEVMQIGHKSLGGVQGFEIIKNADLESFATGISDKAISLLDAKTPPSGDFPVILDPELAGVFIHEALGHASEADIILQNDSILKGRLGQKIGSDLVTVIDDASIETGFGYYPYDVEGTKSEKTTLVENGVFKSVLSSRETASKVGDGVSSGNARSSVSNKPLVRMSNTYIKPGESSFEELIEDLPNGIYLKGSRGGQVDTGKGIFQFNAVEAYNIEKGELGDHLRDVSLSGTTLDILNNITGVGSDFNLSVGFCGKDGQTVPVGDGGPHIRVSRATVGGVQ